VLKKSKSLIPSYIVFGLLLGLVQCSETAMRSALYEPDLGGEAPAGPDVSMQEQSNTGRPVERNLPEGESEDSPAVSDDVPDAGSTSDTTTTPSKRSMRVEFSNKDSFVGTLWPEASSADIQIKRIRMDLKTLKIEESLGERHLTGYLVVEARDLKTRHLPNEGSVIFAAAGATDIMQAQFRISPDLFVVVDMSRAASRSPKEADLNPWEGSLSLLMNGKRHPIGKMSGIVTLLKKDPETQN